MCLDRMFVLSFLGSHYLMKAAGLVSSGGFAVPTIGILERLYG